MGSQTRVIIGSESQDSLHVDLDQKGSKVAVPVTLYDSAGKQSAPQAGIVTAPYDYMARTLNADGITEVYVYRLGGSTGTLVATVTIVYTDSTLGTISTVTKT